MSHHQPPPATHLAFTEAAAQQINQSQLEHDSLGLETYMLNLVLYEAADIKPASGTNQLFVLNERDANRRKMCSLPVAANESVSLTDSVSLPGPQCFLFEIYGNLMGANMGHWLMHETLCFRLMTSAKYKIRLRASC